MFKLNVEGMDPYDVNEVICFVNGKGGKVYSSTEKGKLQIELSEMKDKRELMKKVKKLRAKTS